MTTTTPSKTKPYGVSWISLCFRALSTLLLILIAPLASIIIGIILGGIILPIFIIMGFLVILMLYSFCIVFPLLSYWGIQESSPYYLSLITIFYGIPYLLWGTSIAKEDIYSLISNYKRLKE